MQRQLTVLHVDDDPDMLALSEAAFERVNEVTLVTKESATQALEVLSERAIDCVVSDSLVLPNGIPLVKAVHQQHGDVPILLFTAKEWVEVADIVSSAGIAEYVQKAGPGDLSTVIERVNKLVDHSDELNTAFEMGMTALEEALSTHADASSKASFSLAEEWELIGQWVGNGELATTLIESVEDYAGLSAIEKPLFDSVDPDALEALLQPLVDEQDRSQIEVRFPYYQYELAVTSTGDIFARPMPTVGR